MGFCPGCAGCGDACDYDYYDIDDGIVEPGSSRSGMFSDSGKLAGQLRGHCCPSLACAGEPLDCGNTDEFAAQFDELETIYPIMRRWLEIGGTIDVDSANSSSPWLGRPNDPFRTVLAANDFAWDGSRIKIRSGSYAETPILSKQLILLGDGGTVTIGQ